MASMHPTSPAPVLVVDDDLDIRATLRMALEDEGYDVIEASDGVAALRALRASARPMVVLLDLMMPRLDGEGVLAQVADDHRLAQHYFLLVTAKHNVIPESLRAVLGRLAVPVLAKPLDLDHLLDIVAAASAHLPPADS